MAEQFARWHPAMAIVSLRFSNVYSLADYGALPAVQTDPASRKWNLWSYIDADDAAQACRCALEAQTTGHEPLIIAAADNLMGQPSRELMAAHFPGVPLAEMLAGEAALLSSARASKQIGFLPKVSWRDRI
jgi:nucleoside-diphosphate-sugar epimerase